MVKMNNRGVGKDWKICKLGTLTSKIGSGATPKGGDASYKSEGTPLIRSLNVRFGSFRFKDLAYIDDAQAKKLNNVIVEPDDVLFNITGASVARACLVPSEVASARVNQHVSIIRCKERLSSKFLLHYILSPDMQAYLLRLAEAGATRQAITKQQLEELDVPLPPLPEQQRIVARLDKAQQLIDRRKEQLAMMDGLVQSLFYEMFGDPVRNERGWEVKSFHTVCESRLGKMLDQKKQTGEHGRSYLRNANVQWFRFDLKEVFKMDFNEKDQGIYSLQTGDILICEGGEPGRAAIWDGSIKDCYFQKALHRARIVDGQVTAQYIIHLLWNLAKNGGLSDYVTSATIAHLTGEKLKSIPVPVPPLPLQQAFADRVQQIEALKQTMVASLAELEHNFKALMQEAFGG